MLARKFFCTYMCYFAFVGRHTLSFLKLCEETVLAHSLHLSFTHRSTLLLFL